MTLTLTQIPNKIPKALIIIHHHAKGDHNNCNKATMTSYKNNTRHMQPCEAPTPNNTTPSQTSEEQPHRTPKKKPNHQKKKKKHTHTHTHTQTPGTASRSRVRLMSILLVSRERAPLPSLSPPPMLLVPNPTLLSKKAPLST